MGDAKQATEEATPVLGADDRAWLDEQLRQYADLLTYFREH